MRRQGIDGLSSPPVYFWGQALGLAGPALARIEINPLPCDVLKLQLEGDDLARQNPLARAKCQTVSKHFHV